MTAMPYLPAPAQSGLFAPVIGRAPPSWPWALPHLYAVNTSSRVGDAIVRASADPEGSYREVHEARELGQVEVIGYWRGEFHVVSSREHPSPGSAVSYADGAFDNLPVRFLLQKGALVRENTSVEITGTWPAVWKFTRVYHLGILSAYLFECASAAGAADLAGEFRSRIHSASPTSEQVLVYVRALEYAQEAFASCLPAPAVAALPEGISAGRGWLGEMGVE